MASMKDAVEEALQDSGALIKYFVFAIPLYVTYYLYTSGQPMPSVWFFAACSLLVLVALLVNCTINVRDNKTQILPTLNIIALFKDAVMCLVAITPSAIVSTIIANFLISKFTLPVHSADVALKAFICFAFFAVVLTSFLLYAKDKSLKEAYNLKAISDYGADIMLALIFMIPQLAIVNLVFLGIIAYVLVLFLGFPNPVLDYIICIAVVINTVIIANYLAQIAMENIEIKIENKRYENGKITFH